MKKKLISFLLWGIVIGIGIPVTLTWLVSEVMSIWSPLALLVFLGVLLLWVVGLVWTAGAFFFIFIEA